MVSGHEPGNHVNVGWFRRCVVVWRRHCRVMDVWNASVNQIVHKHSGLGFSCIFRVHRHVHIIGCVRRVVETFPKVSTWFIHVLYNSLLMHAACKWTTEIEQLMLFEIDLVLLFLLLFLPGAGSLRAARFAFGFHVITILILLWRSSRITNYCNCRWFQCLCALILYGKYRPITSLTRFVRFP